MIKRDEASKGIKLLTRSTSVRWFGWGLGEAFIPIFLLLFSTSFFETGLLASIYYLVFFLSIPIAGYLADNIKIKNMVLTGLILYIFIGLGYFLAGITSAAIFLILARGLNGVSYSLDQVGRESYFMRHTQKNKISRIFGHFDFIATFWWITAVLIGLALVKYVPIHWLLFFIAPTSIVSFLMVLKLKEKSKKHKKTKFSLKNIYLKNLKEIKNLSKNLKLIMFFSFCIGVFASIIYFFVPISSYLGEGNLIKSVILVLAYSIPVLFGDYLGKIADKNKHKIYPFSFIAIILVLTSFILFKSYIVTLITIFTASLIFELTLLTNKGFVARFTDRTHLGEVDGSLNGVAALGAITGPVIFGLLVDIFSINKAYFAMALFAFVVFILIVRKRKILKS
jgi:MFS family permease